MSSVYLQLQLRDLLQRHIPWGARRSRVASAGQMSEGRMLAAEKDKQRTLKALGGFPF
jgi:hypothetical protein